MGRGGKPVAYQKRILGLVKGPLAPVFALAAIITAWEIWVHVKNVPQFLLPAPSAMIWLVAIGIILFETIHIGGRKLMPWHDRDT